jgi:hypothetical protein
MDMHNISPKMEMYDFEKIVEKYSTNRGAKETDQSKFFTQLWMPFAWAAILGFTEDKSIPLETENLKKDTFKYYTINNNSEKIFQALILFVVAKKGYEILQDPFEINKTIEEYANGGFEILHTQLREFPEYFNDETNFINFILDIIEDEDK